MFEWMDRSFRIWIGFPRIKNTTNICNEISSGWKTYYETLVMQPSYVMFCIQPIHSNHFKKDLRSCSCILCAMSPFLVTAPKPVNRKQKNSYSHSLHNGSIHWVGWKKFNLFISPLESNRTFLSTNNDLTQKEKNLGCFFAPLPP